MEIKLEPCPFCGSDNIMTFQYPFQRRSGLRGCYVKCRFCGASTGNYETIENAVEAWNMRKDEKK